MNRDDLPRLDTEFVTREERQEYLWGSGGKKQIEQKGGGFREKAAGFARRIRRSSDHTEGDLGFRKLLIKTGICAGVAVVILAISVINTPTANDITDKIESVVNHEFDIDEDIGRLKFVKTLEDSVSVFNTDGQLSVVQPYDGEVVTCFGEGGSSGIRIAPDSKAVYSIAKGTVTAVGLIGEDGYLKILLDSGEEAAFHNMSPEVQVDDIVKPGQRIGSVTGDFLYVEMKAGGEYIDPVEFIQSGTGLR